MIYPWQESLWSQLVEQHAFARLPQALLLLGAPGLGKRDFAMYFAKKLLCESPSQSLPCERCRSCHLFENGSHPDYYYVAPEETSEVIKIDQIRDLIHQVNQTSQLSQGQVVVIDDLNCLNEKSANGLLKTIEEPSGSVFFLCIADRLGGIPITLISRCQRIPFYLSDLSLARVWLEGQCPEYTTADREILLRLSQYAPLAAKAFAEKNLLILYRDLLKKLTDVANGANPLSGLDAFLKPDLEAVFLLWMLILHDVLQYQLGIPASQLISCEAATEIQTLAKRYPIQAITTQLEAVKNRDHMLRARVPMNPLLTIESLLLMM